ncbi:MAG TPA: methyltransferase domain-containing protein [Burkholderiales bacterium]|nr:methyltransferase domain-containing protein [Burkholderiales bacterium]
MLQVANSNGVGEWLDTPLGQYLLEREQAYYDRAVADVFGYNAFQLGMPELELLRASRIPLRCRVATHGDADLSADFRDLPIATNSADLVLLPHVLEFAEHPHQILREVARVLMPEAHVVISGFNPFSLWGIRRRFHRRGDFPWRGRFMTLMRVKDWLALLGFEVIGGQMACYAPPSRQQKWLERFRFMEAAGDRWWPIAGGVYFLQAVKRVRGVRLIMPKWSDRLGPVKQLAASPQKIGDKEDALAARVREQ